MKIFLLFLPLMLLVNSCDHTNLDPTLFNEGFQGITLTMEGSPEPIGYDINDWCSYFRMPKPDAGEENDVEVPFDVGFSFGPAFPNPSNYKENFIIPFHLQSDAHVNIYIIDKNYRTVKVIINNLLSAGSYQFTVQGREIGAGIFRVVFASSNKVICTGDVWIRN
jgi:hypothetical protein